MGIDAYWMGEALRLARRAAEVGEVPVGAVVVHGSQLVGEGWNQPIHGRDPTAHAEIVALRAAAKKQRNYRLPGHTLYVTLEPCVMCAGAVIQARLERVVYAAADPKAGAAASLYDVLTRPRLNHAPLVEGGLLAEECGEILRDFFRAKRSG